MCFRLISKMNRDIVKGGTTIYAKKPFAYVLYSEYRTTRCDNCLKSGELLTCSNCRYVYYCNHSCQKESWPIHKAECPLLIKVLLEEWNVVPDTVRLMARIILKLNQGGADEVDYYTETNSRKFEDLMSHESDIKKDTERMKEFINVCSLLYEFFGETQMLNLEEVMGIFGKIYINGFSIFDFDLTSIACGIYLGPSVIDHSCKPNAIFIFDGPTLIIRTLIDLPCLDWSQIRISYVDLLSSNKNRREKLHNAYYFWCDCERCQSDPMAEAAACPNSLCDSPYSIDAEECEKCGTKLSKEFKEIFREVTNFTAQNLKKMKTNLDLSKTCLEKQKNILHRFNVQHVRTLEAAYKAALNLKCLEDMELYGNELMPGYLLYYGELYHSVGLLYFMIARIQLHLRKSKEALLSFTKACSVLKITHGEEHSVLREEKADFERLFKAADLMAIKLNVE